MKIPNPFEQPESPPWEANPSNFNPYADDGFGDAGFVTRKIISDMAGDSVWQFGARLGRTRDEVRAEIQRGITAGEIPAGDWEGAQAKSYLEQRYIPNYRRYVEGLPNESRYLTPQTWATTGAGTQNLLMSPAIGNGDSGQGLYIHEGKGYSPEVPLAYAPVGRGPNGEVISSLAPNKIVKRVDKLSDRHDWFTLPGQGETFRPDFQISEGHIAPERQTFRAGFLLDTAWSPGGEGEYDPNKLNIASKRGSFDIWDQGKGLSGLPPVGEVWERGQQMQFAEGYTPRKDNWWNTRVLGYEDITREMPKPGDPSQMITQQGKRVITERWQTSGQINLQVKVGQKAELKRGDLSGLRNEFGKALNVDFITPMTNPEAVAQSWYEQRGYEGWAQALGVPVESLYGHTFQEKQPELVQAFWNNIAPGITQQVTRDIQIHESQLEQYRPTLVGEPVALGNGMYMATQRGTMLIDDVASIASQSYHSTGQAYYSPEDLANLRAQNPALARRIERQGAGKQRAYNEVVNASLATAGLESPMSVASIPQAEMAGMVVEANDLARASLKLGAEELVPRGAFARSLQDVLHKSEYRQRQLAFETAQGTIIAPSPRAMSHFATEGEQVGVNVDPMTTSFARVFEAAATGGDVALEAFNRRGGYSGQEDRSLAGAINEITQSSHALRYTRGITARAEGAVPHSSPVLDVNEAYDYRHPEGGQVSTVNRQPGQGRAGEDPRLAPILLSTEEMIARGHTAEELEGATYISPMKQQANAGDFDGDQTANQLLETGAVTRQADGSYVDANGNIYADKAALARQAQRAIDMGAGDVWKDMVAGKATPGEALSAIQEGINNPKTYTQEQFGALLDTYSGLSKEIGPVHGATTRGKSAVMPGDEAGRAAMEYIHLSSYNVAQRPNDLTPGMQQYQSLARGYKLGSGGMRLAGAESGVGKTYGGSLHGLAAGAMKALTTDQVPADIVAAMMAPEALRPQVAGMVNDYYAGLRENPDVATIGPLMGKYWGAMGENANAQQTAFATETIAGRHLGGQAALRYEKKPNGYSLKDANLSPELFEQLKGFGTQQNLDIAGMAKIKERPLEEIAGIRQHQRQQDVAASGGSVIPMTREEAEAHRIGLDVYNSLQGAPREDIDPEVGREELSRNLAQESYDVSKAREGGQAWLNGEREPERAPQAAPAVQQAPSPAPAPAAGGNGSKPPSSAPAAAATDDPDGPPPPSINPADAPPEKVPSTLKGVIKKFGGAKAYKAAVQAATEVNTWMDVPHGIPEEMLKYVQENAPDLTQAYWGFAARYGVQPGTDAEGGTYHDYSRASKGSGQGGSRRGSRGGPRGGNEGMMEQVSGLLTSLLGKDGQFKGILKAGDGEVSLRTLDTDPDRVMNQTFAYDTAFERIRKGEPIVDESMMTMFDRAFDGKGGDKLSELESARDALSGRRASAGSVRSAMKVESAYSALGAQAAKSGQDVLAEDIKMQGRWLRGAATQAAEGANAIPADVALRAEDALKRLGQAAEGTGKVFSEKLDKTLTEVSAHLKEHGDSVTGKMKDLETDTKWLGAHDRRLASEQKSLRGDIGAMEAAGVPETDDRMQLARRKMGEVTGTREAIENRKLDLQEEMADRGGKQQRSYMALMSLSYLPWQLQFAQQWGTAQGQEAYKYSAGIDMQMAQASAAMGATPSMGAAEGYLGAQSRGAWAQYYVGQGAQGSMGGPTGLIRDMMAGSPEMARGVGSLTQYGQYVGYGLTAEMIAQTTTGRGFFMGQDRFFRGAAAPLAAAAVGIPAAVDFANGIQGRTRTAGEGVNEARRNAMSYLMAGAGFIADKSPLVPDEWKREIGGGINAYRDKNILGGEYNPFYIGETESERRDAATAARPETKRFQAIESVLKQQGGTPEEMAKYALAYSRAGWESPVQMAEAVKTDFNKERLAGMDAGSLAALATQLATQAGGIGDNRQSAIYSAYGKLSALSTQQLAAGVPDLVAQSAKQWGDWPEKLGLAPTQALDIQFGTAQMTDYQRGKLIEKTSLSSPRAWSKAMQAGVGGFIKSREEYDQSAQMASLSLLDEDMIHQANWDEQRGLELAQRRWQVSNVQYDLSQQTTQLGYQQSWMQRGNALEDTLTGLRNTNRVEDADMGIQRLQLSLQQSQQSQQLQAQQNQLYAQQVGWQKSDIATAGYRADVQLGWQLQDIGASREKFQLQQGWQMEDFDEAIRTSSGRQRLKLKEQRDRAVQLGNYQERDFETSTERANVQHEWGDDDRAKQLERLNVEAKLRQEAQKQEEEMNKKNLELMKQQLAQEERRRKELVDIVIPAEKAQEALRREQATKQLEWSQEKLKRDKAYYAEIMPLQAAYNKATDDMQEGWARYQATLEVGLPEAMKLAASATETAWKAALGSIQTEVNNLLKSVGSTDGSEALKDMVRKVAQKELERTYRDAGASAY